MCSSDLARFFWEGVGDKKKYHMVRWEDLSRPKDFGGLGFTNTRVRNICLLNKWIFKLENGASDLCCQILRNKYMGEGGFFQSNGDTVSQFWKSLHKVKRWFKMATSAGVPKKTLIKSSSPVGTSCRGNIIRYRSLRMSRNIPIVVRVFATWSSIEATESTRALTLRRLVKSGALPRSSAMKRLRKLLISADDQGIHQVRKAGTLT